MTENITEFLLEYFPDRGVLTFEDFTRPSEGESWDIHTIGFHAYSDDYEREKLAFQNISRPWPEIDWFEIDNDGGYMVPGLLNKKSFIHAFPSLLNHLYILPPTKPGEGGSSLAANFLECLDLAWLKHLEEKISTLRELEWRKAFYESLSDEVKRMVCQILLLSEEKEPMGYAEGALESYWKSFAWENEEMCGSPHEKSS